jgi:predicted NBD/HSP70 family sugar kinase
MVYIGVDLHRKRSQLAAIDEAGEAIFNRSIPSHADEFLRIFGELGLSRSRWPSRPPSAGAGSPTCWPTPA